MPGRVLFTGKIINVSRDVSKGRYTVGRCLIAPFTDDIPLSPSTNPEQANHMTIPFQNEFLYAAYTDSIGKEETEIICTVPDLISMLGEDGEAIGSQELRYGLKVTVIGMPAHPLWTEDERGLRYVIPVSFVEVVCDMWRANAACRTGGPEYFFPGRGMKWVSIGEYRMPRSVIDEFGAGK